jgi:hypothetical protein
LGAQGVIRDVWVFDRNNAWAVGEIYLNDSTGKPDMGNPYNAARLDGSKWTLITTKDVGYGYGENHCIFAFDTNDIWVGSSIPEHWDGQKWTFFGSTRGYIGGFRIKKIWGISSQIFFLVGEGGNIYRYNGTSWTKMTSNTTVDLEDIYGLDATHIWATGTNSSDGHSVVLQYNGTSWTTLYDSNTQPDQSKYQFGTVWTNTSSSVCLDGGSGLHTLTLSNLDISSQIHTGQTYVSYRVRGTLQNDIFDIGQAGEVAHYNGSSWYLYSDLQTLNGGYAWFYGVYPTKEFVVIGGLYLTALNGFPVIVRGYR